MTPLAILSEEPRGSYREGGTFNYIIQQICDLFVKRQYENRWLPTDFPD